MIFAKSSIKIAQGDLLCSLPLVSLRQRENFNFEKNCQTFLKIPTARAMTDRRKPDPRAIRMCESPGVPGRMVGLGID